MLNSPLGHHVRLRMPTIAISDEGGKETVVQVPAGTDIVVFDGLHIDGTGVNRTLKIEWDGKTFKMFAVDIQERGERMAPAPTPRAGMVIARGLLVDHSKRLEIRNSLKSDLDKAHSEYVLARINFERMIKETPSGIPQPDGDLRLRQGGAASRAALQRCMDALDRFTLFTMHGTVPEDVPPSR